MPASVPTFEFLVEPALSGIRIDSFLAKHLRNYNSWRLQRIAREGGVRINYAPATDTDRVFTGQIVQVRLFEPPDKLLDPEQNELPILYEDPWMLVVCKPAGMISHPVGESQTMTLANTLQGYLDNRAPYRGILRPGIVHRLDRQTSGVMVVALTHNSHAALAESFEFSRVNKTYVALVEGSVSNDTGTIDCPIGRAPTGRHVLMSCRPDALERRPSRTNYQVLRRFSKYTLVLAKPRTGRNHQIRVHFAHLGHPLVGDEFYEARGRFKPFYSDLDKQNGRTVETGLPIQRHALHAASLEFSHPVTGIWMRFEAPLPDDFQQTIDVLES